MTRPKITPAQMAELYKKIRAISENREARKNMPKGQTTLTAFIARQETKRLKNERI